MGMFSEIHADGQCKSYEDILLKAIETQNADIINFCKLVIYPKYKWDLGEAFREEDETIKKWFADK